MESLFLTVLNMSITAGWLVLAVLALRLIFKKAPKSLIVIMWALVGIRLLCPFTVESALSLIPSSEPVPQEILASSTPHIQTGVPAINAAINPVIGTVLESTDAQVPLQTPAKSFAQIATLVWLVGAALMLMYAVFSYLRIHSKVREGMHLKDRLWLCDHISSPFILGIFRPRIYIPSSMGATDLEYVMEHENAHLKRKDHWWKPLGFGLLSIHWFNPLLWLGYVFLCRDIELACDEAVLRKLGADSKKPYSEALLNCSIPRRTLAACPLAFGEVGVKTRIKSVLNYKKPALWIIVAALLTGIAVAVCFLTNPKADQTQRMHDTVRSVILSHHRSEYFTDNACCTEYEVLGMEERGKTTTLYLSVMYQEYRLRNGVPYKDAASHHPAVITLVDKEGRYTLEEYWEPTSAVFYKDDIRKKFPAHLHEQALNKQQYAQKLQQSCEKQAKAQQEKPADHQVVKLMQEAEVREKYPQYYGLSIRKGLEVCVWQTAENRYSWALVEGQNRNYTAAELIGLRGTTLQEMQTIVASYGLSADEVTIRPIFMPYSSYYYSIDSVYQQMVEQLFRESNQAARHEVYHADFIDTMTFDIDGDGIEECCTLSPTPTSGAFSFTLSVTENGVPEYYNIYTGTVFELSFHEQPDGQVWLCAPMPEDDLLNLHFRFAVRGGNIILIRQQQKRCPSCTPTSCVITPAPFVPTPPGEKERNLSLAIAAVLQGNHCSENPDGLLRTQSYAVLDKQWVSETPNPYRSRVTLCLLVQQMEYSMDGEYPREVRGQYIPMILTFEKDILGQFTLMEYEDQAEIVLSRFPEAANSERYIAALEDNCGILALRHQYWQQGRLGEDYDTWKQRYDFAMEVKDFA